MPNKGFTLVVSYTRVQTMNMHDLKLNFLKPLEKFKLDSRNSCWCNVTAFITIHMFSVFLKSYLKNIFRESKHAYKTWSYL